MKLTQVTLATASSVLLLATIAACGGTEAATDPAAESVPQQGRPGGMPGASGTVADVSGTTAQVQSRAGQVAVTWTGDTTFTEEVEGSFDDVVVGACVMVAAEESAAGTVRVVAANDDDGCGFGGGGPGGTGGPDGGGQPPEGAPADLPSDAPEGGRDPGTLGEVTSVSADGFTVSAQRPGDEEGDEVTVTVDAETTFTTTAAARASAVTVGRCVVARGASDDTGAVAAETISVSDPVDGECRLGGGAA